jgi:hypothetical protein
MISDRPGEVRFFFCPIAEGISCDHSAVLERVYCITRHALRIMHKEAPAGNTRIEAAWMGSHAAIA